MALQSRVKKGSECFRNKAFWRFLRLMFAGSILRWSFIIAHYFSERIMCQVKFLCLRYSPKWFQSINSQPVLTCLKITITPEWRKKHCSNFIVNFETLNKSPHCSDVLLLNLNQKNIPHMIWLISLVFEIQ